MSIKNNKTFVGLFVTIMLIALFILLKSFLYYKDFEQKAIKKFENAYRKTLLKQEEKLKKISALYVEKDSLWENFDSKKYSDESLYIFENERLVFWSKNEANPDDVLKIIKSYQTDGIEKIGAGWYQFYIFRKENVTFITLNLIFKNYPVTNKFLKDFYNKNYFSAYKIGLTKNPRLSDYKIENKNGVFLVGLIFKNCSGINSTIGNLLAVLWILIFSIILWMILRMINLLPVKNVNQKTLLNILFSLIATLTVYYLACYVAMPFYLKQTFLFEPWINIYFLKSRGDVVLFSIFLFLFSYFTLKHSAADLSLKHFKIIKVLFPVIINFLILIGLFYLFDNLYYNNLKHSDISIGFLFRYDFFELIFLISLVLSIFFLQISLYRLIMKNISVIYQNALIIILITIIFYFIITLSDPVILVSAAIIQIFTPFIVYFTPAKQTVAFLRFLLLITLYTLSITFIINQSFTRFKNFQHKNLVKELTYKTDSNLIEKFDKLKNDIKNDIIIKYMLEDTLKDGDLTTYISEEYLNSGFYNYDIQLTFCRKNYLLSLQPQGKVISCVDFFNEIKKGNIFSNNDSTLFLIDGKGESSYYLGEIVLRKDSAHYDRLYVEFFSSLIPKDEGFPDIIIDEKHTTDFSGFTIAKYINNELVYQYGDFDYHAVYDAIKSYPDSSFFALKNYIHYKINPQNNEILIVSRPSFTFSEKMGTFSLLFILFSFISLVFYTIYYGNKTLIYLRYSFNARLQIFFISTQIILFILLAGITTYYFFNTRKTLTLNQLNEKSKSVLLEIEYNLEKEDFTHNPALLQENLKELSMVFFTDINIFDDKGKLMATSQPRLFEEGFIAPLIDPAAYKNIVIDKKLVFLNTESIGKLKYYSEYVPVSLSYSGINGIINIPYFTRQNKIKSDFLKMLFNYLNLFVLVGIIGTIIAILVSRYLTRPLLMLQKSLAEISITKKNKPLKWNHEDEIGKLIKEYNRMVKKLEESAELLKQTERESAWREIAQQIAHEIRNPLTPMKLNVQYLRKIFHEDNEKFDKKFNLLTASIINQIEALNEVASMFTDLARNSSSELTQINIIPLIRSSVLLYNNTSGTKVEFETDLKEAIVLAHESELLRVFNNLIKNAVQAINDNKGKVTVQLKEPSKDYYEIRIIDTGKGISEEMKKKIFTPYFTTKTSGTGLGLAIVKNIIEELGGSITFLSEEGLGSVFIIKLKKA